MSEVVLPGGNAGGAVLVDGTVRRPSGTWTPAIHSLLEHLEAKGFPGVPRARGLDDRGREVLTYVPGTTIGDDRPWPTWVHSIEALRDVGTWLRGYHEVVADFHPAPGAIWRTATRAWNAGDVVGHNDAAPYNAVWRPSEEDGAENRLIGFIDWDFAAPCPPIWDLAFVACAWVPLHARHVAAREGFTEFDDRPRRLRLLLKAYGYEGTVAELLDAVHARIVDHASSLRALADAGDPVFTRLVDDGVLDTHDQALVELERDRVTFL